jgi:voltage-gated potassium channel
VTGPGKRKRDGLRRHLHAVLEGGASAGPLGWLLEGGLIVLIVVNVVAVVLGTERGFAESYAPYLKALEAVSVAIFTLEYAVRLWCAADDARVRRMGPVAGRLVFAMRPLMVIDLLSFLPAYLALVLPGADLRILRLFRLVRLLKIARYSPALQTLIEVVAEERRALFGTLLLLVIAVMFAATAMYLAEGDVQPKLFGSIPLAMWWAITTLTTVGYGDAIPVTGVGRVIAGLSMIIGLGIFALPIGIMATAFVNAIHRRDFVVTLGMLSRVPMFAEFDAGVLGEVMGLLRTRLVKAGQVIAAAGEPADAMYFVVSGEVVAELPERTFRFGPGDFFGERALLHKTRRTATMSAVTPCRLLMLGAGDFASLLKRHPEVAAKVHEIARVRLMEIEGAREIAQAELDEAGKGRQSIQDG